VSCVSMAQLRTAQLTDRVLSDVSVISVSCVSMAPLRTAQLTDSVLSDASVISVCCVSMAQLRTAQLTEHSVVCSCPLFSCRSPSPPTTFTTNRLINYGTSSQP